MDRKLKQAVRTALAAPPPVEMDSFLAGQHRPEVRPLEFLRVQAGYIRWWVWGISLLVFGYILLLSAGRDRENVWAASALTPFLALLFVTESGKSRWYGMEELELSCRFSLRPVLMARMLCLGLFHLCLLAVLTPVLSARGAVGLPQAGLCLLVPYLLTAAAGLEISRRLRGIEGLFACGAASALVFALGLSARVFRPALYQPGAAPFWAVAAVLSLAAFVLTFAHTMRETGELRWN